MDYKDYMNSSLSKLADTKINDQGITMKDIAECTGNWGGLSGRIVRLLNRLARIKDKGWINDTKIAKLLSQLDTEQLKKITQKMQGTGIGLIRAQTTSTEGIEPKKLKNRMKNLVKLAQNLKIGIKENDEDRNKIITNVINNLKDVRALNATLIKAESTLDSLRRIDPFLIISNPNSVFATNFAYFVYFKQPFELLTKENLSSMYQLFISAIADKMTSHNDLEEKDQQVIDRITEKIKIQKKIEGLTDEAILNNFNEEISKLDNQNERLFFRLVDFPNKFENLT